jgi:hypothetical protein
MKGMELRAFVCGPRRNGCGKSGKRMGGIDELDRFLAEQGCGDWDRLGLVGAKHAEW